MDVELVCSAGTSHPRLTRLCGPIRAWHEHQNRSVASEYWFIGPSVSSECVDFVIFCFATVGRVVHPCFTHNAADGLKLGLVSQVRRQPFSTLARVICLRASLALR